MTRFIYSWMYIWCVLPEETMRFPLFYTQIKNIIIKIECNSISLILLKTNFLFSLDDLIHGDVYVFINLIWSSLRHVCQCRSRRKLCLLVLLTWFLSNSGESFLPPQKYVCFALQKSYIRALTCTNLQVIRVWRSITRFIIKSWRSYNVHYYVRFGIHCFVISNLLPKLDHLINEWTCQKRIGESRTR